MQREHGKSTRSRPVGNFFQAIKGAVYTEGTFTYSLHAAIVLGRVCRWRAAVL